jgi:GxxExxY protein
MRIDQFRARGMKDKSDPLTEAIIGAAIEVHRVLGPGLTEMIYESALCHEFDLRGIHYQRQVPLPVLYKGKEVGEGRIDLLVEGRVIVELKACECLTPVHRSQVITYLQIKKLQIGLLINFNVAILVDGVKRVICSA